jgi:3-hydroxyacyl-CoA dehydrogenase
LEIIPGPQTAPEVIDFLMDFGRKYLGKTTVLCKDTPAFIANRIGVYAMAKIISLAGELGLSPTAVDKLTGPAIGRPNTGTFRLADLVGLDTAMKVIQGVQQHCPDDEQMPSMALPKYMTWLVDNEYFGNKSGKGFYEKTGERDANGRKIINELNLQTLEYAPTKRPQLESLALAKQIDNPKNRIKALFHFEDAGGELLRQSFLGLFSYAAHRLGEVTDAIYGIDNALKAGFAWSYGPFEYWDIFGPEDTLESMAKHGYTVPEWVTEMIIAGHTTFYKRENGIDKYYDPTSKSYKPVPGLDQFIILDRYREQGPILQNDELIVHDIGDQVLCAEFRSKSNAIGEGILRGLNEAITMAEEGDWRGLVIGNNAQNFTVGANLMLIGMMAFQGQFDQLDEAVRLFQQTTTRCRFSSVPVVAATQGYVFGGGCETIMHCDSAICAAESYIGLVEVGVGLIPGGAGTKEFAVRASDEFEGDEVRIPKLIERLKTIAMASVATSAPMAYDYGYLNEKDHVEILGKANISKAKDKVIALSQAYVQPISRQDVLVLGRGGLGALYTAVNELQLGDYASEYDAHIARKIAYVLCGGDLTGAQRVSEQYLLDLEREAFLSLCGEAKTQARIQHMLEKNKPLRN